MAAIAAASAARASRMESMSHRSASGAESRRSQLASDCQGLLHATVEGPATLSTPMSNLPMVSVATRAALAAALIAGCGDNLSPVELDAPPAPIDAPIDSPPTGDVPRAEPTACRFDVPPSLGTE